MEKFRISNDLSIFWSITEKDGSPYNLSDKTVRLIVTHPRGRMDVTSDITVQGNVICWLFRGSKQRFLGNYKITAEIQSSPADRVIKKDIPEAFALVSSSQYEQTEVGRPDINETGNLRLATSLDIFQIKPIIPQVGPNRNWWVDGADTGKSSVGLTAYEFAKENGYEGTEEEYAAECLAVPVLNEESRIATAAALKATEQSIAQQESVNNYMNDVAEPTIARATKAASDAEQVAADIRSEADAALEGLDSAINSVNEAAETANTAASNATSAATRAENEADRVENNLSQISSYMGGTVYPAVQTAKNAAAEATAAAEQAEKDVDAAIEAFGPAIANKADLDNGKIIPSQFPDYILGQVMYGGLIYDDYTISASSNFISKYGNQTYLSASDASKYSGVYFIASGSFTDRTIVGVPQVSTGDWIISTGESWKKVDNSDAVTSVAGLVGNVNASALAAVLADLKDANSLARKSEFKTINGQSLVGTGNIKIEGKNYDTQLAEQSAKLAELSVEMDDISMQVKEQHLVTKTNGVNLYNNSNETQQNVFLNGSGIVSLTGYCITSPIFLKNGRYSVTHNHSSMGGNAFFGKVDVNGNLLSRLLGTLALNNTVIDVDVEDGWYVFNIGENVYAKEFMITKAGEYPSVFVPYASFVDNALVRYQDIIGNPDALGNKIISFNGDSICAINGGYGKIIAERNNMIYENVAVSGGTITAETYSSGGARHWISRTIGKMRADADFAIVEGGVNDSSLGVPLGAISFDYDATLDDTTFYGAFESMLKQLLLRFQGKKVGYIFVHQMTGKYRHINEKEDSYYWAARQCCEKWGVPFCDLNVSVPAFGLFKTTSEMYALTQKYTNNADGWHPNEEGYLKYYCDKIEAWLKSL